PPEHHAQIWMDLSLNLKAIVAQQLVPTKDGKGRRAVIEVLINTPLMQDLIRKGEVHELKEVIKKSTNLGMQTFDQALYTEYKDGNITYDVAIAHADSPNDLRLMIKLNAETNPGLDGGTEEDSGFFLQDDSDFLQNEGSIDVKGM
ncbi:MAG: type IV pili twitching motility protein PilT, partial [Amphritea sp.]|nr:type IV pili twitching motility protein PilT [Amphritea sp.]